MFTIHNTASIHNTIHKRLHQFITKLLKNTKLFNYHNKTKLNKN
jgi:hypothetical protein